MALSILNRRARLQATVRTNTPALIGVPMLYAGSTPPPGYLLLNGGTFVSATYPELATLFGNTWGAPGGGLTQLPDFRGRSAVGIGTHADVNNAADSDGQAVGSRRPNHSHSANATTHQHGANHTHGGVAHTHPTSGAHSHASVDHTHTTQAHAHGVSGTTGAANAGNPVDANLSGNASQNTSHTHTEGTLFADAISPGTSTNYHTLANGGFTDAATPGSSGSGAPGTHGSSGEATDFQLSANAVSNVTPFLVLNWIVKAEA